MNSTMAKAVSGVIKRGLAPANIPAKKPAIEPADNDQPVSISEMSCINAISAINTL